MTNDKGQITNRYWIGAIAVLGMLETAFLTVVEWLGKAAEICPTHGCQAVLESPYAQVFGLPLPLLGFLAYTTLLGVSLAPLAIKSLSSEWVESSWLVMLAITTCMLVSSSYLMVVMLFIVKGICPYCIASALLSLTLFLWTTIGHDWQNIKQVTLTGLAVGLLTFTGIVGVYTQIPSASAATGESAPPITHISGAAELTLARHLNTVGARMYGAFTCPHCHEQKQLFGQAAFNQIDYIECHPRGENAQPERCKAANIKGVPTWEIQGQFYSGVQPLERLADISGYQGSEAFKYEFPY